MLPIIFIASSGKHSSSIMASSRPWSIDPKVFLKSMSVRYISLWVSLASSRAAVIVCICLAVLRCGRKPSWLKWSIRCYSS